MGESILARRGGGGKAKEPTSWTFLQLFRANGTFTFLANTWYRVYCYGACGNGGAITNGSSNSTSSCGGGGGGGSGGCSVGTLFFKDNTPVSVTVTAATSSMGNYMSATAGNSGANGLRGSSTGGIGGAGGTAVGGNQINAPGYVGGAGGTRAQNGSNGSNNGALGGPYHSRRSGDDVYACGGGGGGAKPYVSSYVGNTQAYSGGAGDARVNVTPYPNTDSSNIFIYGGGSGIGGIESKGSVLLYSASQGSVGIIIIEKGVT